ncbi:MAG TPA: SurA N-terminal domain-containing protein [Polyangia bacterium]|jgi:peptidyl-prolyl cis-trans isomerase D
MLEQMRKSSQSLLIYILFGIVIAVFIINFGPQSRGGGGSGCEGAMGGDESAAHVSGETVSTQAYTYAFRLMGGGNQPPQFLKIRRFKEAVMDRLIERELLATEAQRLGFDVGEEDVNKMLVEAKIIGLGVPRTVPRLQKDGVFNYDQFKNFALYDLGLSPERFIQQQQREMLAAQVRDFMRASVRVSPEEIKTAFEAKNRQINLEYVRFPSRKFEGEAEPTADEIATYVKANEAKLKEIFGQRKAIYADVPLEARLRELVIKVATPADEAAARKRADAVVARAGKGEAFGKLARELSEDEDGRAKGGDLGWKRKGTLGLDDADEAKVLAAKPGTVVGPFKKGDNLALYVLSGSRQGTLGFDAVKSDLAEERLRQEKSVVIAKQRAEAALALAKAAPDQTLKQLFPGPPAADASADPKAAKPVAKAAKPGAAPAVDARAEETGLFARRGSVIEQIGDSPELAKAAFDLKTDAPLAGPVEVAGSFVVVRLKERKDPDLKELEAKKGELQRDAELVKWNEVLTNWVKSRCLEEKAAGRITVNRTMLKYDDNQPPVPYEPCVGDPDGQHRSPS